MKRRRVIVQAPAEADAEAVYLGIQKLAPHAAAEWFNGLVDAVESLSEMSERCPLTPETDEFVEEIRQLLYGSYRILFTIRGEQVHVLHIRHQARDRWMP